MESVIVAAKDEMVYLVNWSICLFRVTKIIYNPFWTKLHISEKNVIFHSFQSSFSISSCYGDVDSRT